MDRRDYIHSDPAILVGSGWCDGETPEAAIAGHDVVLGVEGARIRRLPHSQI